MLKKKLLVLLLSASMAMTMLAGCGSNTDKKDDTKTEASKDDASEAKTDSKDAKEPELEDGTYKVVLIQTAVCSTRIRTIMTEKQR